MVANHLFGAVASDGGKIVIHISDIAFEIKLNHAHHFTDGGNLPWKVRVIQLFTGDICRIFHDLEWLAIHVENRVVAGLQPDFLASFAKTFVLAFIGFTTGQFLPKLLVLGTVFIGGFHKHAVMVANHLFGAVASHGCKVFIHIGDVAFEVKRDHAHDFTDRAYLPLKVCVADFFGSDIKGVFHDFKWFVLMIFNRHITGL